MEKVKGLPFYTYSADNKWASEYLNAYRQALQMQNKIEASLHNPNITLTEMEKFERDLKRWEKKAEDYSALAKLEETKLDELEQKGLGSKIDFMA